MSWSQNTPKGTTNISEWISQSENTLGSTVQQWKSDIADALSNFSFTVGEFLQVCHWLQENNAPASLHEVNERVKEVLRRFIALWEEGKSEWIDDNFFKTVGSGFSFTIFFEQSWISVQCNAVITKNDRYVVEIEMYEIEKKWEIKSFYDFPHFWDPINQRYLDRFEFLQITKRLYQTTFKEIELTDFAEKFIVPQFTSAEAGENGEEYPLVIIPQQASPSDKKRYMSDVLAVKFFERMIGSLDMFSTKRWDKIWIEYTLVQELFLFWVRASMAQWQDFLEYIWIDFLKPENAEEPTTKTFIGSIVTKYFLEKFSKKITPGTQFLKAEYNITSLPRNEQRKLKEFILQNLRKVLQEKLTLLLKYKKDSKVLQ